MPQPLITSVPSTPFHENIWILPPHLCEHAPFRLYSAGITQQDKNYQIHRTEGAEYYVLEYILRGQGELNVAGYHYQPKAGDVYLLPSGIPNEYHTDRRAPWEKIWFNVSGELMDSLLACYHLTGVIYIQHSGMGDLFRQALETVRHSQNDAPIQFASQLTRIIATLALLNSRRNLVTPTQQLAQVMRDYLNSHWKEPYSLAELSKVCEKSPAQVMRIFQAVWNSTPKNYHTQLRQAAACRYLENTAEPVKLIADWLGFANEFQFSAWFKKQTGKSPRQYRVKE